MITSRRAMVDSNVLIYATQKESEFHHRSKEMRDKGLTGQIPVCVCPQVLFEFFAVITNPRRVTNPILPQEAMTEIEKYLKARHILKVYPPHDIVENVLNLLGRCEMKSQAIFDLQLIATMITNGISRVYTYNVDHFRPFPELEVIIP